MIRTKVQENRYNYFTGSQKKTTTWYLKADSQEPICPKGTVCIILL